MCESTGPSCADLAIPAPQSFLSKREIISKDHFDDLLDTEEIVVIFRSIQHTAMIKPRQEIRKKVALDLQLLQWPNQMKINFNGILTNELFVKSRPTLYRISHCSLMMVVHGKFYAIYMCISADPSLLPETITRILSRICWRESLYEESFLGVAYRESEPYTGGRGTDALLLLV